MSGSSSSPYWSPSTCDVTRTTCPPSGASSAASVAIVAWNATQPPVPLSNDAFDVRLSIGSSPPPPSSSTTTATATSTAAPAATNGQRRGPGAVRRVVHVRGIHVRRERAGREVGRRRRVGLGRDRAAPARSRPRRATSPGWCSSRASRRQRGPRMSTTISSSSSHAAAADGGRWWRSFSTIRATHVDSRGSMSGTIELTGGIGSVAWRIRIAIARVDVVERPLARSAARTRGSPRCRDRSTARRPSPSPARAPCRPACRSSSRSTS